MRRNLWVAAALAILGWWAAMRFLPPAAFSGGTEARAKLQALEAILASRNDNDPRLDRDFNALSLEAKRLFRKKYQELPLEKRNERGIIVFLLGRNLRAAEDWAFLRGVVNEPPCLSLSDCSRQPRPGGDGEDALGDEVTRAYPCLVALKQAEYALVKSTGTPEALEVIRLGKKSATPVVARMAEKLEQRFAP